MKDLLAALAAAVWLAGCAGAPSLPDDAGEPATQAAHVLSNGWHTAIVVARGEVAATGLLPEAADFPEAAFLEFGWGDREYYPADETTLGMTLRAALMPTPSVMHVAGRERLPQAGGEREVVQVGLTETGLRRMIGAISDEFERPAGGRAEPVGAGLYPASHFYEAAGRFHLFNTCNTWTARMLRAGGIGISPAGVISAEDLMVRLRAALAGEGIGAD